MRHDESVVIGIRGYVAVMATQTHTVMYDAHGNETDDRTQAVRGEVVELDDDGTVIRRFPDLSWRVDERALDGDAGETATRPHERQ
jgi:hypothetical protein